MSVERDPGVATPRPAALARAPELYQPSVAARHGARDYWVRRVLAAADFTALLIGAVAAYVVALPGHPSEWSLPLLIALLPGWIALLAAYGLYGRIIHRVSHTLVDDLPSLLHAFVVGAIATWAVFAILPTTKLTFPTVLVFCAVAGIALLTFRATLRGGLQRTLGPERVLLLGVRAATLPLVRSMRLFPEYGQEPVGVLELPGDSAPAASLGVTRIGHLGDRPLDEVLDMVRADRVLVSSADTDDERLAEVLRRCRRRSVKVSVVPTMFDGLGPSVELDHIAGLPLLAVNPPVLTRSSRVAKRAIDVAASAAGLLVLLPVLAIIAVAIKLDSRGPVLFVQQRIGRGGRSFPLFKFRTMVADAEAQRRELLRHSKDDGWLHLEDDPRITRVGRLLRHTSLDELPQLLNVVRGEMSLVGPRPLIVEEDERIDGWRRARLDLTPGITGMWQVLGRTAISFDDMVKLDYLYVTNWSLANDLRLLLRTLPVVLTRRGAN